MYERPGGRQDSLPIDDQSGVNLQGCRQQELHPITALALKQEVTMLKPTLEDYSGSVAS